jgi:hypothetical protein
LQREAEGETVTERGRGRGRKRGRWRGRGKGKGICKETGERERERERERPGRTYPGAPPPPPAQQTFSGQILVKHQTLNSLVKHWSIFHNINGKVELANAAALFLSSFFASFSLPNPFFLACVCVCVCVRARACVRACEFFLAWERFVSHL